MAKTLSSLSVGDTVEVPVMEEHQKRFGETIVFRVADINHEGYPKNSVTLITDKIIQLMAYDASEPKTTTSQAIRNYGNANYEQSNIRQWLNSRAVFGEWYQQTGTDQSPVSPYVTYNGYQDWAGFLQMFPKEFVENLLDTTISVQHYNTVISVTDPFFLLGQAEIGVAAPDGNTLSLFQNEENKKAFPTPNAVEMSAYKTSALNPTTAWSWWLRGYKKSNFCNSPYISAQGSISDAQVYHGQYGLRPACNLPYNLKVSDTVNEKGNYDFLSVQGDAASTYQVPISAKVQPHQVTLNITRYVPSEAVFRVEVTNNPFDDSPVWEDCTQSVVNGTAYEFKNRINVSGQCGFNVRVSIYKGTATETCWLSGVEGRFT